MNKEKNYQITNAGLERVKPIPDEERQPLRYLAKEPSLPRSFEELYNHVGLLVRRRELQRGITRLLEKGLITEVE